MTKTKAPSPEALEFAAAVMSFSLPMRSHALRLMDAMKSGRISAEDLENDMDWLIRNRLAGNTKALDNWLRRKLIRMI